MTSHPPNTRSKRLFFALVLGAASLMTACGEQLPQNTLDPQGPEARQLHRLFVPVVAIAGIVFVLVMGLCIYVVVKFKAKGDDDRPVQVHGNAKAELAWTIAPAVILAVVGIFTVGTIVDINREPKGPEVLQVEVVGRQWWWEYRYPGLDITTANELRIPIDRPVNLRMTSADVIHSFWVPKLAGKVDVVPGRTNRMTIEADKPGVYAGQCAEYCGLSHANMRLTVVAQTPADFAAWARSNNEAAVDPPEGQAADGLALFKSKGCVACHSVKGVSAGEQGPDLTHLFQRDTFAGGIFELNDVNLRRWLRDPPAEKPMVQNGKNLGMPNLGLSEDEITKLIAYLKTLD